MRLSWAAQSHIWRLIDREALMEEHVRGYISVFKNRNRLKKTVPAHTIRDRKISEVGKPERLPAGGGKPLCQKKRRGG